nr:MAG TPA: hypothetical protein [Caudoviricetes sp.]
MSKKNKDIRPEEVSKLTQENNEAPMVETKPVVQSDPATVALYGGHSPLVNAHLKTIEDYTKAMAPGVPIYDAEGANWNVRLYYAITSILRADDVRDMYDGMDAVMSIFRREHNGALHHMYTSRFMDVIMLDDRTRILFCNMMLVLWTFANPITRKQDGRQMHLVGERSLLDYMDVEPRDRLNSYLNQLLKD